MKKLIFIALFAALPAIACDSNGECGHDHHDHHDHHVSAGSGSGSLVPTPVQSPQGSANSGASTAPSKHISLHAVAPVIQVNRGESNRNGRLALWAIGLTAVGIIGYDLYKSHENQLAEKISVAPSPDLRGINIQYVMNF